MFYLSLSTHALLARNPKRCFFNGRALLARGLFLALAAVLGPGSAVAFAARAVSLPSATVTVLTTTSPVVRSTPAIAISAAVSTSFDSNSGPVTATTCGPCNPGNTFCATGSNLVKSQQTITTTSTSVANILTVVKAAPEFASANPTISRLADAAGA